MMWMSIATLALILASGQQAAQGSVANEPATQAAIVVQEPDATKRICRMHKLTGSRLARKKVCMSAEDWRIQDEEMAAEGRAITNRPGAYIEKPE